MILYCYSLHFVNTSLDYAVEVYRDSLCIRYKRKLIDMYNISHTQ